MNLFTLFNWQGTLPIPKELWTSKPASEAKLPRNSNLFTMARRQQLIPAELKRWDRKHQLMLILRPKLQSAILTSLFKLLPFKYLHARPSREFNPQLMWNLSLLAWLKAPVSWLFLLRTQVTTSEFSMDTRWFLNPRVPSRWQEPSQHQSSSKTPSLTHTNSQSE